MNKRSAKAYSEALKKHWTPVLTWLMNIPSPLSLFTKEQPMKDILGREIYPGMVVAYPGRQATVCWQSLARVEGSSPSGGLWVTLLQKNHIKAKGQKIVRITAAVNSLVIVYSNDPPTPAVIVERAWDNRSPSEQGDR